MLGTIGKDFKYKIIKNFLTEEERKLLSLYIELFHRHNYMDKESEGDTILSSNLDTYQYGDYLTDSLMILKRKLIEKEVNKNLREINSKITLEEKNWDDIFEKIEMSNK